MSLQSLVTGLTYIKAVLVVVHVTHPPRCLEKEHQAEHHCANPALVCALQQLSRSQAMATQSGASEETNVQPFPRSVSSVLATAEKSAELAGVSERWCQLKENQGRSWP